MARSGPVPSTTSTALLPFEHRFRKWIDAHGMGWERCDFDLTHDGERTRAFRFSPPAKPVRRVVAFHGAGNDALFAWVGLFKRLLAAGTEIFSFDLPGHGREASTSFSPAILTSGLLNAVAECELDRPPLPLHAVGVSLGASVLLRDLPALQDRLSSATLVVAPKRIVLGPRSILNELRPSAFGLLWREREHYGWTGLIPSFASFKRDIYPLHLAEGPGEGPFGYVAILNEMLTDFDLPGAARDTAIPVLCIYGGRDRIVPMDQGRQLAREMPRAEWMEVPAGTHLTTPLQHDVADRIEQWVAKPR